MYRRTWKSLHPSHTARTPRMAPLVSSICHTGNLPRSLLRDMLHKQGRRFPNSICNTPSLPFQTNHTPESRNMGGFRYRSRQHNPTPHPLTNRSGGHCTTQQGYTRPIQLRNYRGLSKNVYFEENAFTITIGIQSIETKKLSYKRNESPDGSQPKSLRTQDEKEHEISCSF